jgi:hypothetical protein
MHNHPGPAATQHQHNHPMHDPNNSAWQRQSELQWKGSRQKGWQHGPAAT